MLITENKYFLQNNDRHYKQQQKKKKQNSKTLISKSIYLIRTQKQTKKNHHQVL